VELFFECLLYFTTFGAVFTLFLVIALIVIWLLKWFWSAMTDEPETEADKSRQFRPMNLDHLKRAGQ
jgi:hypothetical protein